MGKIDVTSISDTASRYNTKAKEARLSYHHSRCQKQAFIFDLQGDFSVLSVFENSCRSEEQEL